MLSIASERQVKFYWNFLVFFFCVVCLVPALNRCSFKVIIDDILAVLVHVELVKCAIDHSQRHFERVFNPVVLFLILGERKGLPAMFFILCHLVVIALFSTYLNFKYILNKYIAI